jgi:hypothetical protein
MEAFLHGGRCSTQEGSQSSPKFLLLLAMLRVLGDARYHFAGRGSGSGEGLISAPLTNLCQFFVTGLLLSGPHELWSSRAKSDPQ